VNSTGLDVFVDWSAFSQPVGGPRRSTRRWAAAGASCWSWPPPTSTADGPSVNRA